ncbi:hypothetical protein [Nocardioides halotolerans]|uniref:hypothetical protein n=1 Tax=Nocardioides halotolerans TaxID=433660 RepID=UPI0004000DF6|nr:hypothetical protein [Nocardioides halotolerans]
MTATTGRSRKLVDRGTLRLKHLRDRAGASAFRGSARLSEGLRALPLPGGLRRGLYRWLAWRPWTVTVPVERLMLGGQNGLSARQFSEATGDLLWASTRVIDGPHADLLQRASAEPGPLTDEQIMSTPYAAMALGVIEATGNFFEATTVGDIPDVARRFIAPRTSEPAAGGAVGRSPATSRIRVARIRGSELYQVIDGHHRVASSAVSGRTTVQVRESWLPVSTPLEDLLDNMSWIGGARELYQPIPAPELTPSWPLVRKCSDRRDKMLRFLEPRGLVSPQTSYLDVASCYGWFVAEMGARGLDAYGVERDPLAPTLGHGVYGLDPERITVSDAVDFLAGSDARWDVVSCLSLLHHFALGRGSVDAAQFAKLLDQATGKVLFLDTGQAHETWFEAKLPEWTTEGTRAFLEVNTSFDEIIDLGPDEDDVPPYQGNYGRHLFACIRR